MAASKILVVDDEPHIVELLKLYLTSQGFEVTRARTGPEALTVFDAERPDLVILDLMLPQLDGYEVCRRLRRESEVPIIMLTARGDDVDKIVGLEIGADDYLSKPFNPRELVARVKAVLRRSHRNHQLYGSGDERISLGNTSVDPARREVFIAGTAVQLRAKEFDLLLAFVRRPGIVLERDLLLNQVWGYDYFGDTRTIDVHVAHLRDRLEGSTLEIQTVRGIGYKLVPAVEQMSV